MIVRQKLQCGFGRAGLKPRLLILDGPYLVSLLTAGDGAGERLLLSPVHAHRAEDGLGADGAFCGPRLVTVRLLVVYLLLVILTAWRHDGDTQNKKSTSQSG